MATHVSSRFSWRANLRIVLNIPSIVSSPWEYTLNAVMRVDDFEEFFLVKLTLDRVAAMFSLVPCVMNVVSKCWELTAPSSTEGLSRSPRPIPWFHAFFSASPPDTTITWRMLMEQWVDRCRDPLNCACQKLIPSSCCPSSLICLANLLVQPKQRELLLFKYVGLVRSLQVFRLRLRHPTETITWTD